MRRIKEVRRGNAATLLRECNGSYAEMSRRSGSPNGYLHEVINAATSKQGTPRGIGDRTAAKLENGFGKPKGWMDRVHAGISYGFRKATSEEEPGQNVLDVPLLTNASTARRWVRMTGAEVQMPEGSRYFPRPPGAGPRVFAWQEDSGACAPDIRPGTFVYIDPEAERVDQKYCLIDTDPGSSNEDTDTGSIIVRRYHETSSGGMFKTTNPHSNEKPIPLNDTITILGIAVGVYAEL